MGYYIEAIREAAAKCGPEYLKPMLDFYVEQAKEEYQAGALDVVEYYIIVNEYADTIKLANAANYV